MLKTALIILTLSEAGTMHMALTEVGSMEDCTARAEVVGQILTGSGMQVEAMRCGTTDLALTPYRHGVTEADMQWHYLVEVQGTSLGDGFDARPVEPGQCDTEGQTGTYCAVSAQGPLAE